jgi:hypothetical protein
VGPFWGVIGGPPPPPPPVPHATARRSTAVRMRSRDQRQRAGVWRRVRRGTMATAIEKLCRAAESGNVAEIERQIAAGADPNVNEGTGKWTPLQEAASSGHVAAIAALLKAGARVDGADSTGNTPLMLAAWKGHTAAIDALVAAGADSHRANKHGNTALQWASSFGELDAARVLLEAGARTDVCNRHGDRPIDVVRCAACSLTVAAWLCHVTVPPRCHAQVCTVLGALQSTEAALRALFASAAPWSRRRPVAVACYGVGWEVEA